MRIVPAQSRGVCRSRSGPGTRRVSRPSCAATDPRPARVRGGTGSSSTLPGGSPGTRSRPGQWHVDPPEQGPGVRAVDAGRLGDVAWHGGEVSPHPEHPERHEQRDEGEHDREPGVEDSHLPLQEVERSDDALERQRQPEDNSRRSSRAPGMRSSPMAKPAIAAWSPRRPSWLWDSTRLARPTGARLGCDVGCAPQLRQRGPARMRQALLSR